MDLFDRKYGYFLEVAKTGSLQKAGQNLGLTQPALTAAIRRLEEELNIKLFQRHRHGLSLSPDGERFHRWLAEQERTVRESFKQNYLANHDTVRIGASFFFLQEYLKAAIPKTLKGKHELQLLSRPKSDLIRALEAGYLDFAFIGWNGPLRSDLEHIRLFDCPCAIVGLQGHHDHIRDYDRLAQLDNEPWVFEIDWPGDRWLSYLRDRKGMIVDQHHLYREYFLAGAGVSEIEVHYFPMKIQKKLVYSLVPSSFTDGWEGVIFRRNVPDHIRAIAMELSRQAVELHKAAWPGLKNGSPLQIRNYIERR